MKLLISERAEEEKEGVNRPLTYLLLVKGKMGEREKKFTQKIYLIWDSLQEFQNSKRIQIVLNNERKVEEKKQIQ